MSQEIRRVRRKRRVRSPRHYGSLLGNPRFYVFAGSLIAGFILGYLSLAYAPRAYTSWRETRLVRAADESLARGDLETAVRLAQEALTVRHQSVPAFRVLAEATEKQNRAETVSWRAQIARYLPADLDAQLNLASAALRFAQLDTAKRALENVPPQDRDKAAYHVVAGWLARAQGHDSAVEQHFAAAVEREPENQLYQFNLAALQIRGTDRPRRDAARDVLTRLARVPDFRAGALRALLSDAIEREDFERADRFAQDLQMSQQVTFADYLLVLDLYRKLDAQKFEAALERVKPVAAQNAGDLAALMEWMNRSGLAAEVLKWSEELPPELSTVPPTAVAIAEAFAEKKNWSRLKRWTRSGEWGDTEYLRLAYQAFASRQMKQTAGEAEFDSLWRAAERAASDRPEAEALLARLAEKWNLGAEADVLWMRVARHPTFRREALEALYRSFRAKNDLRQLLQIARQLHETSPREPRLAADYARLALVLEPSTSEAQRIAREAYETAPDDVNVALTYAFSLYASGRTNRAVEILQKLPANALLDPHLAVYAALMFLDDGQIETAKPYLEAARKGLIYPEERQLLNEATGRPKTPSPSSEPSATPPVDAEPTPDGAQPDG